MRLRVSGSGSARQGRRPRGEARQPDLLGLFATRSRLLRLQRAPAPPSPVSPGTPRRVRQEDGMGRR
eukprot:1943509-Rhodomonas_salina.1